MSILPIKRNAPIRLLSEDDVKQMLDVDDFRKVTKNQVVQLVSSLSQMDPEVAKKVIEQVPDLCKTALGMAQEMREGYVEALKANDSSSKEALARVDAIIAILEEELKKDGINTEERLRIIECLNELADKPVEVHKLNQEFIMKGLTMIAGVVGTGLLSIAVVLGTNGKIELPDIRK